MTKLQITLTDQEAANLNLSAMSLGYSLTRFVKFLLGKEALETNKQVPVFKMSAKLEKSTKEAVEAYQRGKVYSVDSLQELY